MRVLSFVCVHFMNTLVQSVCVCWFFGAGRCDAADKACGILRALEDDCKLCCMYAWKPRMVTSSSYENLHWSVFLLLLCTIHLARILFFSAHIRHTTENSNTRYIGGSLVVEMFESNLYIIGCIGLRIQTENFDWLQSLLDIDAWCMHTNMQTLSYFIIAIIMIIIIIIIALMMMCSVGIPWNTCPSVPRSTTQNIINAPS